MTQTKLVEDQRGLDVNERLERLMPTILECGHKLTVTEMLAEVIYGDRTLAPDVAEEYKLKNDKVLVDAIARRLRNLGWYQRKVLRERERKIRWCNPRLEGGSNRTGR